MEADRPHRPDLLFAVSLALAHSSVRALQFASGARRWNDGILHRHRVPLRVVVMAIRRAARAPQDCAAGASTVAAVGSLVSFACVTGALLVISHGMSWVYPSEARRILAYSQYAYSGPYREHRCFLSPEDRFADFDRKECTTTKPESKNYILIGDSYAAHLWFGLASELPVHVMEAAASLCRPILDGSEPYPACGPLKNYALEQGIKTADAILLAANWEDNDLERLGSTIAYLHNHSAAKIVVFGPIVRYMHPLPDVLGMAIAEGRPDIPTLDQQPGVPVIRIQDGRMREIALRNGGSYISIVDTICPRVVSSDDARSSSIAMGPGPPHRRRISMARRDLARHRPSAVGREEVGLPQNKCKPQISRRET